MQVAVAPELAAGVFAQLERAHATQTAPFEALIADYGAVLRHNRELEVWRAWGVCAWTRCIPWGFGAGVGATVVGFGVAP